MKTQFNTAKEAQEALRHARGTGLGFCPLIKKECRCDCVCYEQGYIGAPAPISEKKYWAVHYPCCTNVLIIGEIRADVSY